MFLLVPSVSLRPLMKARETEDLQTKRSALFCAVGQSLIHGPAKLPPLPFYLFLFNICSFRQFRSFMVCRGQRRTCRNRLSPFFMVESRDLSQVVRSQQASV